MSEKPTPKERPVLLKHIPVSKSIGAHTTITVTVQPTLTLAQIAKLYAKGRA